MSEYAVAAERVLYPPAITLTNQITQYNVVIPAIRKKVDQMEKQSSEVLKTLPGQRSEICRRCGRRLKTPASIEIGFGAVCYKKFMAESIMKPLFKIVRKNITWEKEE